MNKEGQLEAAGYYFSAPTGGQPRKTYYTPDGRKIRAIPSMREYQMKHEDGTMETGERDANYDKGWLDQMPTVLKLYCKHCDKWHDTEKEIEDCGLKHKKLETWGLQMARKMHPKDFEAADKIASLEDQISRLTKLVEAMSDRK